MKAQTIPIGDKLRIARNLPSRSPAKDYKKVNGLGNAGDANFLYLDLPFGYST